MIEFIKVPPQNNEIKNYIQTLEQTHKDLIENIDNYFNTLSV